MKKFLPCVGFVNYSLPFTMMTSEMLQLIYCLKSTVMQNAKCTYILKDFLIMPSLW